MLKELLALLRRIRRSTRRAEIALDSNLARGPGVVTVDKATVEAAARQRAVSELSRAELAEVAKTLNLANDPDNIEHGKAHDN